MRGADKQFPKEEIFETACTMFSANSKYNLLGNHYWSKLGVREGGEGGWAGDW